MKACLFLLLPLAFSGSRVRAQESPKGPWLAKHRVIRTQKHEEWVVGWEKSDTTTAWQNRRVLLPAPWDVSPDSIRLFLNCDNPLLAPPKPLPGRAPVCFAVTGATLRFDQSAGKIWLFAESAEVQLTVYQSSTVLFVRSLQAMPPPLPEVTCFISAPGIATFCKPHSQGNSGSLVVKAIPDADFATFMPEDARYRVTEMRVTLLRQEFEVAPPVLINSPAADLSSLVALAKAGDKLKIDVLQVQRMNSHGEIETVPIRGTHLIDFPGQD